MKLETSSLNRLNNIVENSRFGSAIVNLGDLQNDGFEDFAVGAPFEGNGAVYIYRGSINPKATLEKGWISKYDLLQ